MLDSALGKPKIPGSRLRLRRHRREDIKEDSMEVHQEYPAWQEGACPVRSATVRDEVGDLCSTSELQQRRWRRHFTKILNIQSKFDEAELDNDDAPSREELERATGKIKMERLVAALVYFLRW